MEENERLEHLLERRRGLEQSISNIQNDIDGAEKALIQGEEPGRLVEFLRERHKAQGEYIYDLGQTEVQIEDLQVRIADRNRAGQEATLADREQTNGPAPTEGRPWYQKRNNAAQTLVEDQPDRTSQSQRDWFVKKDTPEQDVANEDRDRTR